MKDCLILSLYLFFFSQERWSEKPKVFLALISWQMWHSVLHGVNTALQGRQTNIRLVLKPITARRRHLTKTGKQFQTWGVQATKSSGQGVQCKDIALCSAVLGCPHFRGKDTLSWSCGWNPKCLQGTHQTGQNLGPSSVAHLLDNLESYLFCSSSWKPNFICSPCLSWIPYVTILNFWWNSQYLVFIIVGRRDL